MGGNTSLIKRSLLELQRDFGKVIPVESIMRSNPEVSKKEVEEALNDLKSEGIITILDEETIQVNI